LHLRKKTKAYPISKGELQLGKLHVSKWIRREFDGLKTV
jgi:hypothetical protein